MKTGPPRRGGGKAPGAPAAQSGRRSRSSGPSPADRPLWAPWRMAYIGGPKTSGCIFCDMPRTDDRREALVLAANASVVIIMNRYPYTNGHLMVAPRRHTADVNALPEREYADLMSALRRSMVLLRETLSPEGMNVGLNLGRAAGAGITEHMHWHIVPRWVGDVNFMPMLAEVPVIPEHIEAVYDRLRPVFASLDSPRV